jgi:hypothetical protein
MLKVNNYLGISKSIKSFIDLQEQKQKETKNVKLYQ